MLKSQLTCSLSRLFRADLEQAIGFEFHAHFDELWLHLPGDVTVVYNWHQRTTERNGESVWWGYEIGQRFTFAVARWLIVEHFDPDVNE